MADRAEQLKQEGNQLFYGFTIFICLLFHFELFKLASPEYKYDEAAEKYTQAIEQLKKDNAPKYAEAVLYCNRSFVYARMENFQKALEDANIAISLEPDYVKVCDFLLQSVFYSVHFLGILSTRRSSFLFDTPFLFIAFILSLSFFVSDLRNIEEATNDFRFTILLVLDLPLRSLLCIL